MNRLQKEAMRRGMMSKEQTPKPDARTVFDNDIIAKATKPIPLWIRFMLLFRRTIKVCDSGYCSRYKIYKDVIYLLSTKKKGGINGLRK